MWFPSTQRSTLYMDAVLVRTVFRGGRLDCWFLVGFCWRGVRNGYEEGTFDRNAFAQEQTVSVLTLPHKRNEKGIRVVSGGGHRFKKEHGSQRRKSTAVDTCKATLEQVGAVGQILWVHLGINPLDSCMPEGWSRDRPSKTAEDIKTDRGTKRNDIANCKNTTPSSQESSTGG